MDKRGSSWAGSTSGVPKIMVFRPTMEEMSDFSAYLEYVEAQGAHKAGLAKIIPPREYVPRRNGYDDITMTIPSPISQVVTGGQGLYQQYNIQKKAMTVKEFKKLAESERYRTPVHFDYEDLERKYWKNVAYNPPIYGADVSGSLYDPDVKEFNINHLNTVLDLVGQDYGIKIDGVNTAYLYFGMWKTTFAWHTEDMDLYSINYLHFGAPKSWYCIPPEHGRRLERLAAGFFHSTAQECSAFLRHKMTVISPQILKQYSIPFNKITQEPGEFMITFPYGYHAGFNHGFNCAESTNFALPRWVEYGKRASQCTCRQDCVKIHMDVFVKKFQPDRYELWLSGRDVGCHPEDPTRTSAAPPPTYLGMVMLSRMGKPKSKRHPVASVADEECLKEEDCDGDTDGTEIYDPEETVEHLKKQSRSKQSKALTLAKRKGAKHPIGSQDRNKKTKKPRVTKAKSTLSVSSSADALACGLVKSPDPVKEMWAPAATSEEPLSPLNLSPTRTGESEDSAKLAKLIPLEEVQGSYMGMVPGPRKLCMGTAVRRQPLHPAPKKGRSYGRAVADSSDEGSSSGGDNAGSGGLGAREPGVASWAAPYMDLWSFRPASLYAERQFNRYSSTIEPHCAVCILFHPLKYSLEKAPREKANVPEESAVWMPALCFGNGNLDTPTGSPDVLPEIPDSSVSSSPLLVCSECSVCVHAHCYGVPLPVDGREQWKCDRCAQQAVSVDCCLCTLRGGAMKPTTHGRWSHLLCALLVPEVSFGDRSRRSPVDVQRITLQRARLRCSYCHKLRGLLGRPSESGACIQCTSGRCTTAFHVTCAHAAGVTFETYDWPLPVFITCTRHTKSLKEKKRPQRGDLPQVEVGDRVVAQHKNGRYYWGRVRACRTQDLYAVDFEDNSSSSNLLPEDIVSRDCVALGPPSPGEMVSVRWTDGKLYRSVFKGSTSSLFYTVEFEDESERNAKREAIFAEGEELPKRVKSSLRQRKCSTQTCLENCRWKVVAGVSAQPATTPTTSCSCEPEATPTTTPRCPPLYLRREEATVPRTDRPPPSTVHQGDDALECANHKGGRGQ